MIKAPIVIQEYDPMWAITFARLRTIYCKQLDGLIADVQHVGSTAVPGLAAKPVIDIDLVITGAEALPAIVQKLSELGYDHKGNQGITGREAFRARSGNVPLNNMYSNWPKHHLYVCLASSESLRNHLSFRNFLLSNPAKAAEYAGLKKKLAAENPFDANLYVEKKTPFITSILLACGFNEDVMNEIAKENTITHLTSKR